MKKREFWKVCKKLANEERVDVLRKVMVSPDKDGLPVGQIADAVRIGQPATSTYLAQLQDVCGLVACTRQGRYCLYRAVPDSSDAKVTALFQALKKFFLGVRQLDIRQRGQAASASFHVDPPCLGQRDTRPPARFRPCRETDRSREDRQGDQDIGHQRTPASGLPCLVRIDQSR